jgi:hypothetical protein
VLISGEVKNDSIPVENVHIINKNAKKGTISNNLGQFKISVTDLDTLIISDIQFENKIVIINQDHLLKKYIEINLLELTNELDEVIVMQYENMAEELGLPNAGKEPLAKLDRNLNHYSQKSTPMVILEALLFKPGGIDDIYNIVSGNRKTDRKLKQLLDEDKEVETNKLNVQVLRAYFQDSFFINTVMISEEQINPFIEYCLPKGIMNLYEKGRLIEVIDIFLKSKDPYLLSLEE